MLNVASPAKYSGVVFFQGRAAMLELVGMMQFQSSSFAA